ncbi:alpha/beta fold hydrolase [Microdochium nivale]|nr:alpha/beta fold hydrolase [Microdochium nivale]
MRKTLLLCFIHGFKGGEDTFGEKSEFSQHLATILSVELPRVDVRAVTYPKYETRGDLHECVARFRDWLLEKVIDIEVALGTPSPTVDPSVHVILIGHSMGGIVAAETVLAITSEKPIEEKPRARSGSAAAKGEDKSRKTKASSPNSLMFPYIQGVLAFDTPYLGISPGVVAHGAEGHYNNVASAWSQISGLGGILWPTAAAAKTAAESSSSSSIPTKPSAGALPAPPPKNNNNNNNDKGWANWGKMAMYAGAAGAVAAGGAAAYMNRETISDGWSWVGSHLEFVGCLARGEELRARVSGMARLGDELGVGFANLYTRLGKAASPKQVSMVGTVMGGDRTFCNLPKKTAGGGAGLWMEAVNDKATDEAGAHMAMFESHANPGYIKLSEDAKKLIVNWTRTQWYVSSALELECTDTPSARKART